MAITKRAQQDADEQEAKDNLGKRTQTIADKIIKKLGHLTQNHKIDIHPLFKDRFRVNIIIIEGEGLQSTRRIAHSYYILDTPDGLISDPPIEQLY